MKDLKKILQNVPHLELVGKADTAIKNIQFEVQAVEQGDVFFAVIAYGIDGHQFIQEAIDRKASVIVCEVLPAKIEGAVAYVQVNNALDALSMMAANYYDNPTQQLKMIGVTGTNGKTSTVSLLHQLFRKLGYKVGLLSTIVNKVNDREIPTTKTTPHAKDLQALCREMVEADCEYCFMEVSSHGIHQRRLTGIHFAGAVFTNITHDHLDYHGSFEEYFQVKKSFLDSLDPAAFIVYNLDDPNSPQMVRDTKAVLKSVSVQHPKADFFINILEDKMSGLVVELEGRPISLALRAAYNAYNALSAYAVALLLGKDQSRLMEVLPQLQPVEGRFEYLRSKDGIVGLVDYAHTPNAFVELYKTLTKLKTNRLITVAGCGGDKDKEKRPAMARVTFENSDLLILTSDNPRMEEPQQIVDDMLKGIPPNAPNVTVILDRKKAIAYACSLAKSQDIVLVAGKGHEKYQEIKGVKHPFDDKLVLSEMLGMA